jgi:hypothetical protein
MIAHIYPSVLQAVSGRGYAGCLDGCFQGYQGEAMQDLGYELPRIHIPRSRVHRGTKQGSDGYDDKVAVSESPAGAGPSW